MAKSSCLLVAFMSSMASKLFAGAPPYYHNVSESRHHWGDARQSGVQSTNLTTKLQTRRLALAKTKLQHYLPVNPLDNVTAWKYGVDPTELEELLHVWKSWEPW